jgi:hypothetical protein
MKKEQSKLIIVEILQNALAGQLKPDCKFNPQHIADAINQKVEFESTMGENVNKEIIETIIERVETAKKENDIEFENLDQKTETLLRNFVRGKSHAYQELLDILNKV